MNKSSRRFGVLCFAALLVAAAAATAAIAAADEDSLSMAIERFVALDCTVGDPDPADRQLKLEGDLAVPVLQRLLDDGPDTETLQTARERIERHWEARLEYLESSGWTGLPVASQQNVNLRGHDEFVERRLMRFRKQVQERAAMGMAAIGSPVARRALADSAARTDGAMSEFIERLLHENGARPARARRANPRR